MKYLTPLFLFLTLACSKIEMGLNFAPRIATSKIDDAFDFESRKLTQIRRQIDSDIQSSKKQLALKMITHIDVLQKRADDPDLKLEQVISFYDEIAETQTTLLNSFKASAELVFKDLSEHEILTFKEYSDKKYAEITDLAMKDYLHRFFVMQIAFWKTATAKQKNNLKKTLASYKEQLQKIASP